MENPTPILKKIEWHGDGHLFGFGLSPEADWKAIFISTVTLMVLVSLLNFYIFVRVNKGDISTTSESAEVETPALDIEKLESTVSYYEKKAAQFEKIKNGGGVSVVDPSL